MKINGLRSIGVALLLAGLASSAWADDSMVLQNAGASVTMGGVYTSPYGISVDGASIPSLLICDDFTTDISLGMSWMASVTTMSQVNSSTVNGLKFDNSSYNGNIFSYSGFPANTTENIIGDYATAAVLAAELLTLPNVGTGSENAETAGVLSYAIWGIFDSTLLNSLNSPGANTGFGSLSPTEVAAVNTAIASAQSLVSGASTGTGANLNVNLAGIAVNGQSLSSLTVYTPTAPNGLKSSQEFLSVSMPEPSYPVILGLDLLAVMGLVVAFRRKISKNIS